MNVDGVVAAAARTSTMGTAPVSPVVRDGDDAGAYVGGSPSSSAADAAGQSALDQPLSIELIGGDATDVADMHAIASRSGLALEVSRNGDPSPDDVLRQLDSPIDTSSRDRMEALRDRLRELLRTGTGAPDRIIKRLDGLDHLIEAARKQEERQRFLKKLMQMLLMGVLTPEVISMAKSLGLVKFLKQAIESLARRRMFSPDQLAAIAALLGQAGISVPLVSTMVAQHDYDAEAARTAACLLRGVDPGVGERGRQVRVASALLAPTGR